MTVGDESLANWLDALASAAPAPGGGAAAALCGVLGAALVSMVARFTVGRPKYAAVEIQAQELLATSERLRSVLTALVAADADAYHAVAAAYKLAKATDAEKAARNVAIQAALVQATDIPLRIAEAAHEVIEVAAVIAGIGNRTVLTDAGAAALFGQAALQAALLNVTANLGNLTDPVQQTAFAARLDQVQQGSAAAVTETLARIAPPTQG